MPAPSVARAEAGPGRRRGVLSRRWRRVRPVFLRIVLAALLAPTALLLIYRFLPVPITPLMLIRLVQGEGLRKDWVPLEQIAPALAESVVASEDNQFCEHFGFDWRALRLEAAPTLPASGRAAPARSPSRPRRTCSCGRAGACCASVRGAAHASDRAAWPKQRIVEVYLNVVELGPGVYGAEAAARRYFAKPAAKLSRREAALLAAVLPNPRRWSPARPSRYLEGRVRTIETRIGQLGPMLDCVRPG